MKRILTWIGELIAIPLCILGIYFFLCILAG